MALTDKLTNIANAIRSKTGKTNSLTLDTMVTEIQSISGGGGGGGGELPEEAFIIQGDCTRRFSSGGWDWFINAYSNQLTTANISNASYMFSDSTVENIPFEINMQSNTSVSMGYMFRGCKNLKTIPKINNAKPSQLEYLFQQCYNIREFPDDMGNWFDWSAIDNATSVYSGNMSTMFNDCYSLRSAPIGFLSHGNPNANYSYGIYNYLFVNSYVLDEIVDLPNPHLNATWTSNTFYNTFKGCGRLKNMTFAMPDGQPYVVKWKSQTIDLSANVGYMPTDQYFTMYNSGITADKRVINATDYEQLKNDPDWFTCDPRYCRYNHDSAVATINSLPDTSAYLASAGGTNTIKFKGNCGTNTDGGAISNLTEAEIAVAAAKGWTVSIV